MGCKERYLYRQAFIPNTGRRVRSSIGALQIRLMPGYHETFHSKGMNPCFDPGARLKCETSHPKLCGYDSSIAQVTFSPDTGAVIRERKVLMGRAPVWVLKVLARTGSGFSEQALLKHADTIVACSEAWNSAHRPSFVRSHACHVHGC